MANGDPEHSPQFITHQHTCSDRFRGAVPDVVGSQSNVVDEAAVDDGGRTPDIQRAPKRRSTVSERLVVEEQHVTDHNDVAATDVNGPATSDTVP